MQDFPRLIEVMLETNHKNNSGVAWYAYFSRRVNLGKAAQIIPVQVITAINREIQLSGEPLSIIWEAWEEVENKMSRNMNCFRYYVGSAG